MRIISGPASQELGRKVAELSRSSLTEVEPNRFLDGESHIRFKGSVENEEAFIIQTTGPPQEDNLVQLLLMIDNARDMGAKSVTAVIPYFAYVRQDKRFRPGEAFSAKTVVRLIQACGATEIITINSHSPTALGQLGFPIEDLSAVGLVAQYFKDKGILNVFSLSLGKKGLNMAEQANNVLGGGYGCISTQRDVITGNVTVEEKSLPVDNRNVVIFDDIISSGRTMAKAVALVKRQNPKSVYAACIHPLFKEDAKEMILRNGADGIVGTDTVTSNVATVSVAPLIAEAITRD